ncbi:hypothetical protein [Chryseobacterium jejuense]|uniref:Uncharacterized protein n=1 Tax=Chryseobacterium jejuense TaxID=445960 RepID=A0ABY0Q4B1_CHRJE|nr:hypothetical protein [Chryseobacterium jejuense]SDJ50336.1 hypothetical protein SAMN05421542_3600 [Chryseobacterium jejuense]
MKQILLLIVFIMCLSCTQNGVTLNFCDAVYHTNKNSCLVLNNDTGVKYIFYPPSFVQDSEWGYLGGNIVIVNKEGKEPKINTVYIDREQPRGKEMDQFIFNKHKDSLLLKKLLAQGARIDYWGVKKYKVITKSKFVLASDEEKTISKKISIFKKDLEASGSYYTFDKKKEYFIQIELNFDSTEIKKYLPEQQINSLKKKNIKIFHGVLKTKKIPFILD